ncbi:hypothetical protein MPH_11685 [Macrophomina phaseolina MS6]|uniref:Uncharacterized protein n=1 Tax=Macrophomina phaseolina (strain MS6) TaxID=1126212 RepID=K2RM10_MACPH|nr:hypothetical protein MPH_11685 [Macrophomina phaseolina MS6]
MIEDEWALDMPIRHRKTSSHDFQPKKPASPAQHRLLTSTSTTTTNAKASTGPTLDEAGPRPPSTGDRRQWPPRGYTLDSMLDQTEAEELICAGASIFKGRAEDAPGAPAGYYRFFAIMEGDDAERNDRARQPHDAYKDITLAQTMTAASSECPYPWLALEQPCMAYAFGWMPGTVTLNYKDPEELYHDLHSTLLEVSEPDGGTGLENQITDLIIVLTREEWIDFSQPKNHVVAKFFDAKDTARKTRFFHQLLLAVELHMRIHHDTHLDKAKRALMAALPPKVAWDMALAERWQENMTIKKSRTSKDESVFSFQLGAKKRQKEALRLFAKMLKWPNMQGLDYVLEEKSRYEVPLEDRSADAMSWFAGVILPGPTLPWLLMNSLIDCDKETGPSLKYLTHVAPASGFQYRANTYWSYKCIVGKVLGASRGVKQVTGWIGPCYYSPDLKRTECVKINQISPPKVRLRPEDVETMKIRTDPLGPEEEEYPLGDYDLLLPEMEDITDDIRVQKLSFHPVKEQPMLKHGGESAPLLWDAAIVFACGGDSWPMRLTYDVDFVAAYPCHQGPHVLFFDYKFKALRVDDGLVDINEWGPGLNLSHSDASPTSSRNGSRTTLASAQEPASSQLDCVLVIEALGVSDNEVFARSWCAQTGHHAVVANIKKTCMACAIREAYAACISVVILTEGGRDHEKDED